MARHEGKPPMNVTPQPAPRPPPGVAPAYGNPAAEAMATLGGALGMTQTRTGYQTAIVVQVPRNIDEVRAAVLKEATYAREGFFYAMTFKDKSKNRTDDEGRLIEGKSVVEGCSIDGAMILFRNWGNVAVEPELLSETPSHWLMKVTLIDLEKGISFPRLFRQRKAQKLGKFDEERAMDIAFQIGQSKAIRNAIVGAMPQWLIDDAMDAAKASAAERYKDVQTHAEKAINGWASKGISKEQLERKLGKKRADWIPADLVLLRAIWKAIELGHTSVGQEFSDDEPEEEGDQGQAQEDPDAVYDQKRAEESIAKATQAIEEMKAGEAKPPEVPPDAPKPPEAPKAEAPPPEAPKPAAAPEPEPPPPPPPPPDFQPPTTKKK